MVCYLEQVGHRSENLVVHPLFHRFVYEKQIDGGRDVADEEHDGDSAENVEQRVVPVRILLVPLGQPRIFYCVIMIR